MTRQRTCLIFLLYIYIYILIWIPILRFSHRGRWSCCTTIFFCRREWDRDRERGGEGVSDWIIDGYRNKRIRGDDSGEGMIGTNDTLNVDICSYFLLWFMGMSSSWLLLLAFFRSTRIFACPLKIRVADWHDDRCLCLLLLVLRFHN